MRKMIALTVCLFVIALAVPCFQTALAETSSFAGEWVCVALDDGDGVKKTEYEGINVSDLMKLQFNQDGTLQVSSLGESMPGTWKEDKNGISAVIDSEPVEFEFIEGQLVSNSNGTIIYLEKVETKPKSGGLLSLVKGNKYAGTWIASAVDEGDGVLKAEFDGVKVSELMSFVINRDGTLVMNSMGQESSGTWQEINGGINVNMDSVLFDMMLTDNQLVAKTDGVTIYFIRSDKTNGAQAQVTPPPAKKTAFAGIWKAVRYEMTGYTFDINMLFPDGCTITLLEDGTGEAFITNTYTEKLTWSELNGSLTLNGSYVFSSPVLNEEKEELTVFYGSSAVSVIFQKSEDVIPNPIVTPIAESTPMQTSEPTVAPLATEKVPSTVDGETQLCETTLFTMLMPSNEWVLNEGWKSDTESYCVVKYELKDQSDTIIASVSLSASSEGVDTYRDKIKSLLEYAKVAGKDSLDEVSIGGIAFSGTEYENWGWKYIEYTARVPESRITLVITIEQPDNMGDSLQPILDSISFKLPVLTPPNVDPPLPEDGEPYQPEPTAVNAGDIKLTATWLKPDKSIIPDSIFNNQIALDGNRLYVLAGKALYAYTMDGSNLIPDQVFEGGVMKLSDEFEYLSIAKDSPLYVSEGIFNILAIKDGAILMDNSVSGNLVLHPGGEWGISFWANTDPMMIHASSGTLTEEPWVLTNLSDAEKRKGRFSSISCVSISDKYIYVSGNDAESGDVQRVSVFDLDGKELITFGAEDWTADDAFGSITGIVETSNGILVQDGNYRSFKMFTREGKLLWSVECDKLLGTNYPWLSSMIPTGDGVVIAAAQGRKDESCDELLIFMITGF